MTPRTGSGAWRRVPLALELADGLEHLLVDVAVGGQHAAAPGVVRGAVDTGHTAARFLHEQRASRDIPGVQLLLPEPLEPPGRDVTQVERRRPQPAYRARPGDELREEAHQLARIAMDVVVEAGDQKRIDHGCRRRHRHRLAVQPRSVAALRREELLPVGIENRRRHRHAAHLQRHRAAEDRQPVGVVRRAVDRIEHPAVVRNAIPLPRLLELLAEDRVIGKPLGDQRAEILFDRHVDVGDEIDRALLVDPEIGGAEVLHLHAARVHDGFDRGGEKNGGTGSGATGRQLLDHPHFHAAVDGAPQRDVVHEAAHEEDAAAARFQEVLRRQGIGHFVRLESLPLVHHPDDQLAGLGRRGEGELDGHQLFGMLAVAMLDGVDHRFPHGHADPVDAVFVHARHLSDVVADHLDEIQHVEIAVDLDPYRAAACQHADVAPLIEQQRGAQPGLVVAG